MWQMDPGSKLTKVLYPVIFLMHVSVVFGQPRAHESIDLNVGAIIDKNNVAEEICFRKSVLEANKLLHKHDSQHRRIQLIPVVETIHGDDSFDASRKACKLLERQVIAIYGPNSPVAVESVQSLASQFGIPHLQIDWGYHESARGLSLNVHPHYLAFGQALYDYVRKAEYWSSVALIYYHERSLLKYDYLLRNFDQPVMLRKWDTSGDNHKYVIKQFKTMQTHFRFVVDIPFWEIQEFLALAASYNMTSQYYSYVFTDWDIQLVNPTAFTVMEGANITIFSIIQSFGDEGYGIGALLDDIRVVALQDERFTTNPTATRRVSPTLSALLYDGLSLLAMGLLSTSRTATDIQPPTGMTCSSSRVWSTGLSLMNDIKAIKPENFRGLTGTFQFDGQGWRSNINLSVLELSADGFRRAAYWNMDDGLVVTKNFSLSLQEMQSELKGKVLRITTKEEKPYMMYTGQTASNEPKSTDPKDWKGFCIDLLNEIAMDLNFTYSINLVADSTYGNAKIVDGEEVWDGMVQELRQRKADLAVGSFTITYDRDRVIDFTTPFMYLGISILYKRTEDKGSSLFSFLQPLSAPVWGYILAATIMVSLVLFVVARFSPYEWKVNHPCDVNSNMVENKFNVLNSIWFTFGALMQKGSDVLPHATSTRIIAGFWWFFTLIVISSYTANLAAFLTVARMEAPIENAEDLAKQTKIKYGSIQGGSTVAFFEQSKFPTYKRMWQFMSSQKGLLMNSTEEAIRRVKREEYAYILESTMAEYYIERDCELIQVGGLLDSKGYGIGLPEGSKYRDPISEAILKLQNNQVIDQLKFRWWREHDINDTCEATQTKKSDTSSLGVEKVGGCFVMLLIGMAVSLFISTLEFIYNSYHHISTKQKQHTLREELARDFRFSMACSSIRSRVAEEATKLPAPPSLNCLSDSPDEKCTVSAALAYAPCLASPDYPLRPNTTFQCTLNTPVVTPDPTQPEFDTSNLTSVVRSKPNPDLMTEELHATESKLRFPSEEDYNSADQPQRDAADRRMPYQVFESTINGHYYGPSEAYPRSETVVDHKGQWLPVVARDEFSQSTTISTTPGMNTLPSYITTGISRDSQLVGSKLGSRIPTVANSADLQMKKVSC